MMDYAIILFVPVLIVLIWNRRTILLIILASIIAYITAAGPELLNIFQSVVDNGITNPKSLMTRIIASFMDGFNQVPYAIPLLSVIGWLRRHKDS